MDLPQGQKVETLVKTFSELNYSQNMIMKELKKRNITLCRRTISNIIRNHGKKRQAIICGESNLVCSKPKLARNKFNVQKVKKMIDCANPPSQRHIAKKLGVSQTSINVIIHEDLGAKTRKKTKGHKLTAAHRQNRKTNARKLYEQCLAGPKSEFMVTLDEAYIYLDYCNGIRKICYVQPGKEPPDEWLVKCNERWPSGFMIVAGMCGRGNLPLTKVPSKVKVNSEYYVNNVLKPYLEVQVPLSWRGKQSDNAS